MESYLWYLLVLFADTTLWKRKILKRERVDVVFISNFRDDKERKKYLLYSQKNAPFIDGFRMTLGDIYGRLKIINTDTYELLTTKGRRKAKEQFVLATQWAVDNGAEVILLAASTKRLFGRDAKELKEKFPNTIFTIGDNGTAHLLMEDTFRAIEKNGISKEKGKIAVLGAYGILGKVMVETLLVEGYSVVAVGDNVSRLETMQNDYYIEITTKLESLKNIDLVVACTHKKELQLTGEIIEKIKLKERKLIVIDVAEPANLTKEVYEGNRDLVIRQDAGNGYSKNINYILGALSYKKLSLSKGVLFGCFSEAMALGKFFKSNCYKDENWFEVNRLNISRVAEMFDEVEITLPTPQSFGEIL